MKILSIILAFLIGFLILDTFRTIFLISRSSRLIKNTTRFERRVPWAPMRILILGDSTAFGTGSKDPKKSTAGRIATLYPEAEIINLSVNGLKVAGLEEIVKQIDKTNFFEIIIIQIGANDIMRLTPMTKIRDGIGKIVVEVKKIGTHVIILHSGNVWEAIFFPLYARPLLSKRSLEVRDIYKKITTEQGVSYVDLIASPISATIRKNPSQYYADDLLHLSDDGYGLWFDEIRNFFPSQDHSEL